MCFILYNTKSDVINGVITLAVIKPLIPQKFVPIKLKARYNTLRIIAELHIFVEFKHS